MKKRLVIALLMAGVSAAHAQSPTIVQRDPEIAQMVQEVSADSLKAYINAMVSFDTRSTLSTTKDPKKGIGAAREWVVAKFKEFAKQSGGRMTAFVDTTTYAADGKRVDAPISLGNAMAILKGTDPDDKRIFLVSGHLDSRVTDVMNRTSTAPGANDDGSGSALVVECARVMSRHSFPATVIFVTVSGEEQGLLGSHYLAEKAKKEGWQIEAMLNNDIVGSNNSNETNIINNTQIRVFSEGMPYGADSATTAMIRQMGLENDGKARQLARYVKETGERYVDNLQVVLIYRNDRFLRGGDHSPFVERGFAAVRFTEMNENFYHQHQDLRTEKGIEYGDLPKFMDFEYLRKNTAMNMVNLSNLAKAPAMPEQVIIEVAGLGNSTTLNWKAPLHGKVKGYYVLLRESSNAMWQKKFFTTATTINIPYSKDNYFFAVQSVGETGNESLPVVPKVPPRRK
ncbi:M20/M25/M40 family metallo-hydrolase [Chitinophaga agrisoli]|uniref:M20/M25/M40 family metallo-hydrolase n=1 Tax=Chitinophaga agrisoli TaxID=2607653 RepID=A0A5B2W179_9BACT|nr:M28 family peptidase [Chitinophaga agrisoli]KAA2245733.1 M20/M25/M40 family metallo-hydrolase [Chitinophaga agrisoli]